MLTFRSIFKRGYCKCPFAVLGFVLRIERRKTISETGPLVVAKSLVTINRMSGIFTSLRNAVAICLVFCMPCQAVLATSCHCASGCCCQHEGTELGEGESLSNSSCCCAECVSSPYDGAKAQSEPCNCGCHQHPQDTLPLYQEGSRSLSEILQVDVSTIFCTALIHLDSPRQSTFADTRSNPASSSVVFYSERLAPAPAELPLGTQSCC